MIIISGFEIKKYGNDGDECSHQPCQNNCACLNLTGRYQCDCVAGYNERDSDNCSTVNCIQEGTCRDLDVDYTCFCPTGYTGQ